MLMLVRKNIICIFIFNKYHIILALLIYIKLFNYFIGIQKHITRMKTEM